MSAPKVGAGRADVGPDIEICMKNLSARLLDELYKRDCSMNALGRAYGITGSEIGKLLDGGNAGMRLSTLFKISKGLGMKPSAFLASIEEGGG